MNTPGIDRREFLKESLLPAAALPLLAAANTACGAAAGQAAAEGPPGIIDTNVHLSDWPFRRLKYAKTADLIAKLKKHRVMQAWAGTFDAVLHKNLDLANARLAEECRTNGAGMLVPFGSVCPVWPDWEEDLRRCHEVYRMPGVRVYPGYHNYTLARPEFAEFLAKATARGLIVQIAIVLEDERVHHPIINVPPVDASPLVALMAKVPSARVQLLNVNVALRGNSALSLVQQTQVTFDTAFIEAVGAIGRVIDGNHWSIRAQVPASRLLYGSNAPYAPCEAALLRLFESPLERQTMVAIMQENAKRLFNAKSA